MEAGEERGGGDGLEAAGGKKRSSVSGLTAYESRSEAVGTLRVDGLVDYGGTTHAQRLDTLLISRSQRWNGGHEEAGGKPGASHAAKAPPRVHAGASSKSGRVVPLETVAGRSERAKTAFMSHAAVRRDSTVNEGMFASFFNRPPPSDDGLGDGDGDQLALRGGRRLMGLGGTLRSMMSGEQAVNPASPALCRWVVLLLCFVMYNVLLLPVRMCIGQTDEFARWLLAVDVAQDVAFALDIWRNFRTGYLVSGVLVTNPARVAQRYRQSYLWLDVAAALPLDLVQLALGRWEPLVRAGKLLRCSYLRRYNAGGQLRTEAMPTCGSGSASLSKVATLFGGVVVWSHLLACLKFLLTSWEGLDEWSDSAAFGLAEAGIGRRYLVSLLWSVGFTTGLGSPSVPETYAESAFTVLVVCVSIFVFAYVVGRVSGLVDTAQQTQRRFSNRVHYVNRFMSENEVGGELRARVNAYFSYLWAATAGYSPDQALATLPAALRSDLMMNAADKALLDTYLFTGLEIGFQIMLTGSVQTRVCVPGQYIILKDAQVADRIYVVREGNVDVVDGNSVSQRVVHTMDAGSVFGELAVMGVSSSRTVNVRAKTYCTLLMLEKTAVDRACHHFPMSGRLVARRAREKFASIGKARSNGAERIYGSLRGWERVRRYVLARKVVRWLTPDAASRDMVDPQSRLYTRFEMLVAVVVLYNLVALPMRLAFGARPGEPSHPALYAADYAGDMALWLDVALKFRLGFVERGRIVYNRERVRRRYLSGGFAMDAVSTAPWDLAMAVAGPTAWVRAPRLLRAAGVWALSSRLVANSRHAPVIKLARLASVAGLLAHYMGCAYWAVAEAQGLEAPSGGGTPVPGDGFADSVWRPVVALGGAPVLHRYLRSLYYSLTVLTGVGRHPAPFEDREIAFNIVGMLVGLVVVSMLLGGVASVLGNLDAFGNEFSRRGQQLLGYLRSIEVPPAQTARVQRLLHHLWERQRGIDPNLVLGSLPKPLRTDMMLHLGGDTISGVPLFAKLGDGFVRDLSYRLSVQLVPPHEVIFYKGQWGCEMFLIDDGVVDLYLSCPYEARRRQARRRLERRRTPAFSAGVGAAAAAAAAASTSPSGRQTVYAAGATGRGDGGGGGGDDDDDDKGNSLRKTSAATQALGNAFKSIGSGSFFGEGCFYRGVRGATARTRTPATLFVLVKSDFYKLTTAHQEFADSMAELSEERQTRMEAAARDDEAATDDVASSIASELGDERDEAELASVRMLRARKQSLMGRRKSSIIPGQVAPPSPVGLAGRPRTLSAGSAADAPFTPPPPVRRIRKSVVAGMPGSPPRRARVSAVSGSEEQQGELTFGSDTESELSDGDAPSGPVAQPLFLPNNAGS